MIATTNPNGIRVTNLSTNPPVTKVEGGKVALRNAQEEGREGNITGVNWNEVNAKSFVEKLSAVFSKKAVAGSEQAYAEHITSERATQTDKTAAERAPQESGISYENNLKPSWVGQVQNTDKGRSL